MSRSTREYHLKSNRWKTVAINFSMKPRYLYAEVWAPRAASWRRIGIYPGFGKFRKHLSAVLPFGIIQIKFRENRTCTVHLAENPEEVKPENISHS